MSKILVTTILSQSHLYGISFDIYVTFHKSITGGTLFFIWPQIDSIDAFAVVQRPYAFVCTIYNLTLSEKFSSRCHTTRTTCIDFRGCYVNCLGIKNKKQTFLLCSINNITFRKWISLNLYHKVPYHTVKAVIN